MKKTYKLLSLLIIFLSLCSCGFYKGDIRTDPQNEAIENIEGDSTADNNSFSVPYRLTTENQAIFAELIKDNPIDKSYLSEQCGETTQDMINIEMKFADIWMRELDYSCQKFSMILDEENKSQFISLQNDWKNYIANNRAFLNSFFNNSENQSRMGRTFWVERASEYRNEIRSRTLYVKYLLFCTEQTDSETPAIIFENE